MQCRWGLGTLLSVVILTTAGSTAGYAQEERDAPIELPSIEPERKVPIADDPSLQFEIEAFTADYNVSEAEAAASLTIEDQVARLSAGFHSELPDDFAGIWRDSNDMNIWHVGIRGGDEDASEFVKRVAASYSIEKNIEITSTRYSLAELEQGNIELESVLTGASKLANEDLPATAIDYSENTLILYRDPAVKIARDSDLFIQSAENALGDMVTVRYQEMNVEEAAGCNWPGCDPPLRGGIRIRSGEGTGCSSGFFARSNSDNRPFFLTAGHCSGTGVNWRGRIKNGSLRNIGRMHSREAGYHGDSGIIRVWGGRYQYWSPRPWLFVTNSENTTRNIRYPIYYRGPVYMENQRVCRSGGFHRSSCGYVSQPSTCYTSSSTGIRYCGLSRAPISYGQCVGGGDSGGPVYDLHRAHGIVQGRGGSCVMYYDNTTRVQQDRNVTIVLAQQ